MNLYRYTLGDALAGGCVLARTGAEAVIKVRNFYDARGAYGEECDNYKDDEIHVWAGGEGFIEQAPDVVEVYP